MYTRSDSLSANTHTLTLILTHTLTYLTLTLTLTHCIHVHTHTHTSHPHTLTHRTLTHAHTHHTLTHTHQALEEPNFSIAYANLCKVLSPVKVDWTGAEGKARSTNFRRVLLTKCQQEFEKDKKDDENREQMLKAIEEAETVRGGEGRGGKRKERKGKDVEGTRCDRKGGEGM